MAERKAVNKYYPPDWDPRKGSVNKLVGQHPLRDRARKLSQGILVIRFELPYNIWCGGCGNHVGMGVRYNAEKSKVGNYYSTPIYKFRMKCHLCDNYFEIQTDPKNHDYVILNGARRKEQRWDPVANEQIVPEDKATQKKMAMDAMYKLEHGSDDVQKGQEKKQNLAQLESSRLPKRDDYVLNRMARDKFRAEKKLLKTEAEADQAILNRGALDIELLDETEEDRNLAGLLKYSVTSSFEEKQKEKRRSIEQRPLFESKTSTATIATPSSSSSTNSSSSDPKSPNDAHPVKSKLSQVLKMTGKDPFRVGKSSNIFQASRSNFSSLGIRLKSSKVCKPARSGVLRKNKILTKAVNLNKSNLLKAVKASVANATFGFPSSESSYKTSLKMHHDTIDPSISSISDDLSAYDNTANSSLIKAVTNSNSDPPSTSSDSSSSQWPSCDSNQGMTHPAVEALSPKSSALASLMVNYDKDGASDSSDS